MKKKKAPPLTVVVFEIRTNLKNLQNDVGDIPVQIIKSAVQQGMHPTGPQHWSYEWESQNPDSDFKLKIYLPVATFGNLLNNPIFKLEKLPSYRHVCKQHLGAYENLKDTYADLMNEMQKHNIAPGKTCREVYINCDFENPENNITEIQFEVN